MRKFFIFLFSFVVGFLAFSDDIGAVSGICNLGNISSGNSSVCFGSSNSNSGIFYSVQTTSSINNSNFYDGIQLKTSTGYYIVIYNNNGLFGATLNNVLVYWTDSIGIKGSTGATGATGATGPQGAIGLSAYDIAIAGGFSGSEIEWLQFLKGETGATGATGAVNFDFSQTGVLQINSIVNLPEEGTGDLIPPNSSGTYMPIAYAKNGQVLIDYNGFRTLLVYLFLSFLLIYIPYLLFFKKKSPNSI